MSEPKTLKIIRCVATLFFLYLFFAGCISCKIDSRLVHLWPCVISFLIYGFAICPLTDKVKLLYKVSVVICVSAFAIAKVVFIDNISIGTAIGEYIGLICIAVVMLKFIYFLFILFLLAIVGVLILVGMAPGNYWLWWEEN